MWREKKNGGLLIYKITVQYGMWKIPTETIFSKCVYSIYPNKTFMMADSKIYPKNKLLVCKWKRYT